MVNGRIFLSVLGFRKIAKVLYQIIFDKYQIHNFSRVSRCHLELINNSNSSEKN